MANTIITECPACFTRFKVTPGQLRLAGGNVRCGACLLVFKAGDPPEQPPAVAPYNPDPDVDFGDIDLSLEPTTSASAPEQLDDLMAGLQARKQQSTRAQLVKQKRERDARQRQVALEKKAAEIEAARQQAAIKKAAAEQQAAERLARKQAEARTKAQALAKQQAQQQARQRQHQALVAGHDDGIISNPLLEAISTETIQFEAPRQPRRPLHTAGWGIASLLALLLLMGQYGWFERQTLAWQPPWHTLYVEICQQLGCRLPTREALPMIRSQQMLVQDHPDYQEALLIQLILENQAQFAQPWPALELTFTDLKGRTVARRRFQPAEYLDLTQINPQSMPPAQPAQVRLEIMQPGLRAVSYTLSIVKPDNHK